MAKDEILYSGLTSSSSRPRKVVENEEKLLQKDRILNGADVIQELISKERSVLAKILIDLVQENTAEDDLKHILLGIRYADSRLQSLQLRILNILNAKPHRRKAVKEEGSDDE